MLERIHSKQKHNNVETILKKCHPTQNERLWLVGFLYHVGYNAEEIMEIIGLHCNWLDYNENITKRYVAWQVRRLLSKDGIREQRGTHEVNEVGRCEPPLREHQSPVRLLTLKEIRMNLSPPQSLDKLAKKNVDECAAFSVRTYISKRRCELQCESCLDVSCTNIKESLGVTS